VRRASGLKTSNEGCRSRGSRRRSGERGEGGAAALPVGGGGDLAAAKALIPWLNQALGMPAERVEHRAPTSLEDIESMSTAELERLVAEGRARRLQRLESERLGDVDAGGGVVAG
jgi:hypothetical protein